MRGGNAYGGGGRKRTARRSASRGRSKTARRRRGTRGGDGDATGNATSNTMEEIDETMTPTEKTMPLATEPSGSNKSPTTSTSATTKPGGGNKGKNKSKEVMFGLIWSDGCQYCEDISRDWGTAYAKLGSGNSKKFESAQLNNKEMTDAFAKFGIDANTAMNVESFPTLFKVVKSDGEDKYKVETIVGARPASEVKKWLQE